MKTSDIASSLTTLFTELVDGANTPAWKTATVNDDEWLEIRRNLRDETRRRLHALGSPREVTPEELNGMFGSIADLAYHLGAIRQIGAAARGPKEGTFQ